MIKLHHLNQSRSKRIIWLLEELEIDYKVIPYLRDKETLLAPPELQKIHPLGKSPVIEEDGVVITESGAITEYLISKYGPSKLAPKENSPSYIEYLQWIHFAESSAMVPLLLKIFLSMEKSETKSLDSYAHIEAIKVLNYLNSSLSGKKYLVDERLTGADIMMSFVTESVNNLGMMDQFHEVKRYANQLASHKSYQKAGELEDKYSRPS